MIFAKNLVVALRVAFVLLAAASAGFAHDHATGVVKERMEGMETMAKAMKAIRRYLRANRNLEMVGPNARSIEALAKRMPALFPPGTDRHPSEAKRAIWQNWADFESRARAFAVESQRLAEADSRDATVITAQARVVFDACGDCHELYRAKRRH